MPGGLGRGCFVRCSPAKVSASLGSLADLVHLQGVEKMRLCHVKMRVAFRGIFTSSGGGLAGGLAGLVGVLPEIAHKRGVLSLFHAVPHALPLGESVESLGGQHGIEYAFRGFVAALGNGNGHGGAAGVELVGGESRVDQIGELGGGEAAADSLKNNLVFFIDCLCAYHVTGFFGNLVAFHAFSTTILCCKFTDRSTFSHSVFRNYKQVIPLTA